MSGSNQVEVDEQALAAEAAAVVATAEVENPAVAGDPAQPGGQVGDVTTAPPVDSWAPIIESTTPLLREIVLPQYVVTPGQWEAWEKGLIRSMDACFPGGIEGKYGGFVQAGLIALGVGVGNYVMNGRKLPPLGPPRRVLEQKPEASAAAASPPAN